MVQGNCKDDECKKLENCKIHPVVIPRIPGKQFTERVLHAVSRAIWAGWRYCHHCKSEGDDGQHCQCCRCVRSNSLIHLFLFLCLSIVQLSTIAPRFTALMNRFFIVFVIQFGHAGVEHEFTQIAFWEFYFAGMNARLPYVHSPGNSFLRSVLICRG